MNCIPFSQLIWHSRMRRLEQGLKRPSGVLWGFWVHSQGAVVLKIPGPALVRHWEVTFGSRPAAVLRGKDNICTVAPAVPKYSVNNTEQRPLEGWDSGFQSFKLGIPFSAIFCPGCLSSPEALRGVRCLQLSQETLTC